MNDSQAPAVPVAAERLRISEIFLSLQGEADSVGWPTVFVRLSGCPLRCRYCDTSYAFQGGDWLEIDAVLEAVAAQGVWRVCVTGGEPLAQKACRPLLTRLCDAGYRVSLETSGSLDVNGVDPRVVKVVDIKTPGSGEAARNRYCNLEHLSPQDQIKFVLCNRADYEWACEQLRRHEMHEICDVLFSPAAGELAPRELAEWILADRLPVRFQIQLHKSLWGDEAGR
ncbi:7-carboxy-7-deazaguanine synthase QueE [Thiohalobacter sp. IOR34]|uniref:7-carboxy-7-deazaguanine synthase QueE n=1 Tax=Thiohalobacter sp. IOR34 TaxID=3057176 RepID=UPI0025AEE734|nr:7-carboxy-7-deazaguanine synthase QueE [Thiohalobacter sp. IOR34]WJW74953.1 7-carboxy-7-deazaguanine synthase QueE [Thiohalobacter sp. IOR34]